MISSIRAALLGLTEPLSPIMLAVLGLWPEDEEEQPPLPTYIPGGGVGVWWQVKRRRIQWSDLVDDDDDPPQVEVNKNWAVMAMTATALSEILL